MRADDLSRELTKALETLRWTEKHLAATNEGNAALHCNPRVFYSPLTTQVHEAVLSLERAINDLEGDTTPDIRADNSGPRIANQQVIGHAGTDIPEDTERLRVTVGRASALAERWLAAHGSSAFLVRAAGAELRDVLDEAIAESSELAAAECSAQYHGHDIPRLCIRAAQHRGDHVDERGRNWSDTVALYPVSADQLPPNQGPLTGVEVREPCPYCEDCRFIPRREMAEHVREHHPEATVTVRLDNSAATFTPRPDGGIAEDGLRRRCEELQARLDDAEEGITAAVRQRKEAEAAVTRVRAALANPRMQGPNATLVVPVSDVRSALAQVEIREGCPYCTGAPQFLLRELDTHVQEKHVRVLAVLASGGSLDEQLAEPETRCRLPHEMEG